MKQNNVGEHDSIASRSARRGICDVPEVRAGYRLHDFQVVTKHFQIAAFFCPLFSLKHLVRASVSVLRARKKCLSRRNVRAKWHLPKSTMTVRRTRYNRSHHHLRRHWQHFHFGDQYTSIFMEAQLISLATASLPMPMMPSYERRHEAQAPLPERM